jgi:hypothetical protein
LEEEEDYLAGGLFGWRIIWLEDYLAGGLFDRFLALPGMYKIEVYKT